MSAIVEVNEKSDELKMVTNTASLILDQASMASMISLSKIMAGGSCTVPKHLQRNEGDCLAVIMQAMQWQMNPFAVAQKTHLVNGTLGYEAQLVNAAIQSSGVTKDRFNYEFFGAWEKIIGKTKVISVPAKDDKKAYEFRVPDYGMAEETGLGVRISATLKGENEPRVLELLLVQASVRNSPLWATDPKQQLSYLAVKRWARMYCPDVILGVYTGDELEEFSIPKEIDITPKPTQDQEKTLPLYSDADFDKNIGAWEKLIKDGKKTADQIIDTVSSKAILSEKQKAELRSIVNMTVEA